MIPKSPTIAAALVSVALVVLPGRAAAAPPTVVPRATHGRTHRTPPVDNHARCRDALRLPISWSGTQEFTLTTFYETDGTTVAMRIAQGTEQDTFSANGKTLVGDPYHFTFQSVFENGVRVARYEYGNVERVPLPNGGTFIVIGHESLPGLNLFTVDSGNDGNNVAAFCAALS